MSNEAALIKPCPFCGNQPTVDTLGSCISIECCVSMSFQKSDHLTMDERGETSNEYWKKNHLLLPHLEEKVMDVAVSTWNTRKGCGNV